MALASRFSNVIYRSLDYLSLVLWFVFELKVEKCFSAANFHGRFDLVQFYLQRWAVDASRCTFRIILKVNSF